MISRIQQKSESKSPTGALLWSSGIHPRAGVGAPRRGSVPAPHPGMNPRATTGQQKPAHAGSQGVSRRLQPAHLCSPGLKARAARVAVRDLCIATLLLTLCAVPLHAQPVPTFEEVTHHAFGARITTHAEMTRYLEALAEASPRVSLIEQGVSWEERRLLAAVVTSAANQARLEEIRATAGRLGDPRGLSPEEAAALIADQPAVVWMGGSIHGFELSGSEGLLQVLERLTTRDDQETRRILDELVVIVDPMLNPDGRDAFAHDNHRFVGREPNPRRDDWANDFNRWQALGYRTGHYGFDTNRDWFAHTQRETRNRMETFRVWRPQVVVDAHEMGSDAEFYFDPAADPYGPAFPPFARDWFERFHRAYATAFDAAGFDYMSRERYNYFYPGYTTSWGSYQGAVGMLYEQGSSRGLALHRADDTVRTLEHALDQQTTAAWAALGLATAEREELLTDYVEAHRRVIEEGEEGVRRYLVAPGGDPGHRRELAALLRRNGIEVGVLTEDAELAGVTDRVGGEVGRRSFPAGTLVIDTAQPRGRLARVLLAPHQPISQEFLDEARRRVDRGEGARFYDMTAWSLPLLFDLQGFASTDGRELPVEPLAVGLDPPAAPGRAAYAYLLDGRQAASLAALTALREKDLRASVALEPLRVRPSGAAEGETRDLASGTVVVWVSERDGQPSGMAHPAVVEVVERFGVEAVPVDSGLTATGADTPEASFAALGSGDVVPVRTPEVALLAGNPVHGYSFGWAWWVLDRLYEIPLTVRQVGSVASTPLDDFNVLVIPDLFSAEGLAEELGEPGRDRIARWVRDGGTLVVLGEAVELARKQLGLLSLGTWYPEKKEGEEGGDGEEAAAEAPATDEEPRRFTVPGAILQAEIDPETWLSAGYVGSVGEAGAPVPFPALVFSDRLFTAPEGPVTPEKQVVIRYAGDGRDETVERAVVWSGHAWDESLQRLPGKVFAYVEEVGQGRVVAFAEDLDFRGYWRGADRLFLNAVVLGPSM